MTEKIRTNEQNSSELLDDPCRLVSEARHVRWTLSGGVVAFNDLDRFDCSFRVSLGGAPTSFCEGSYRIQ